MAIYIITFIFSLLFIYIGLNGKISLNKKIIKFNKNQKILIIAFGLFLPCLLASLRNLSIGSDTKNYINIIFNMVKTSDGFFDFCRNSYINDIGYLIVTYIFGKMFNNFQLYLFVLELLVIVPIYISLKISCKNKNDIIMGILIFFLLFYNNSFSIIRQTISLSFATLSIAYMLKNNKQKSIIFLIVSIAFHKTAIIVSLLHLYYYLLKRIKDKQRRKCLNYIIFAASITLVFTFKYIIIFLYNTGLYPHGMEYLLGYQKFDFSFIDTFTYLFVAVIIYLRKRVLLSKRVNYNFYFFVAIESLIILQIGMFFETLERISLYLFFPLLVNCVSRIKINKKKDLLTLSLLVYLLAYWILIFVILRINDTIPYEFFWKG